MDTLVQNAPPKDAGSASVPVKGKLLVLGGCDGDNSLATSEYVCSRWRCIPARTSRLHHHLHLVLIIIFAALMDAILVYGYLKWAHPWAGILGTLEFVVPFSSLSSSLKSSTFLREKHHYLNESITIFPSNDILFTQYLFLNKKKVTFS